MIISARSSKHRTRCLILVRAMNMNPKQKSQIQENLLSLYLRLNGYFVTGFIVHSPDHGRVATEIDVLGVRFPYSREPERLVEPDALLNLSPSKIELVICEVKSQGKPLQFNQALLDSPERVASIIRWAGLYQEESIEKLALEVYESFKTESLRRDCPPTVDHQGNTRIRGLLCSPERLNRRDNQAWFISGEMQFNFIFQCLCPDNPRATCATRYDFGQWGEYENIVRYFKSRVGNNCGGINDLYEFYEQL